MVEKFHMQDNRKPEDGPVKDSVDISRRGFIRAAIAGVAAGAVGDRLVSKLDKPAPGNETIAKGPVMLVSPGAREVLAKGNPESIETARGMIHAYAEMLKKESQHCGGMEEQLQELMENDPSNEGQRNLLLCGIRFSTKLQEQYKNAMEELGKLARPHLKDLKPAPRPLHKKQAGKITA